MKLIVALQLFAFFTTGIFKCTAQEKNSIKSGKVIYKNRFYDPVTNALATPREWQDHEIWYKGNTVIMTAHKVYFNDTVGVSEHCWVVTDHYTFMDLDKKKYYEYTSFSDTARLIDKFTQPDTVLLRGCWNFFHDYSIVPASKPEVLGDTLIDGHLLKVFQWKVTGSGAKGPALHTFTAYTDCQKKGSIFTLDNRFSKAVGCPMVRWIVTTDPPLYPGATGWLEFTRDSLTADELKVFAAWEKAARADKTLPLRNGQ